MTTVKKPREVHHNKKETKTDLRVKTAQKDKHILHKDESERVDFEQTSFLFLSPSHESSRDFLRFISCHLCGLGATYLMNALASTSFSLFLDGISGWMDVSITHCAMLQTRQNLILHFIIKNVSIAWLR